MNGVPGDLLPDDTVFLEDLLGLGFVITKDDKIRYIAAPDQGPRYKVNRSDRMNKVHIEALHKAIRTSIIDRLLGMGMHFMKIPKGSKQQVPIMVSGNVTTAPRVVVFVGEIVEDLGVFSYRDACDDGISFGSILGFAKGLLGENAQDSPNALILANAGQNVWHNAGWFAMTHDSVHGQHRASAVDRERPLSARNVIGNGISEHVQNIFEGILMRSNFRVGARIDIIGLSEGGHAAMTYLKNQWSFWSPHISSLSLINPETIVSVDTKTDDQKDPKSFAWFMKYRCRAWAICDKPIGTRVPGLNLRHGCNTYSSGECTKSACMITRGVGHILTWMNIMHYSPMAIEKFDVVPSETDPNGEGFIASLINNDILPGGKIEVHSLEVMNQIQSFLTGVTFTEDMVTFFDDKLYPGEDDTNESDDDSECSAVYRVENNDAFDALPDVLPAVPGGPADAYANALPTSDDLNVLPDPLADALSVPETPTYYDDVIVGKAGPFELSDLQDIREEDEEE